MSTSKVLRLLGLHALLAVTILQLGACVSTKKKLLDAGMKPMSSQELQAFFSEKGVLLFQARKGLEPPIIILMEPYRPPGRAVVVAARTL